MAPVTKNIRRALRICGTTSHVTWLKHKANRRHRREVAEKLHAVAGGGDADEIDMRPSRRLTGWDIA